MSHQELLFTHKPLVTQNNGVQADSYQNLIRSGGRSPKSLDITGFFGFSFLLPLNRRWRFAGDVVADAVDAADFVDDADGDAVEDVVGDARPVGGHEIAGVDSTQSKCVIIRPTVAHDADGSHIGPVSYTHLRAHET